MNGGRVILQPVGGVVLVPLQGPVSEGLLLELRDAILGHLAEHGARGIVLDMSGIEVLDDHDLEGLRRVAESATLMGAPVVMASMRPGVAAGLTMLDVDDHWVRSVRTVEQGISVLA